MKRLLITFVFVSALCPLICFAQLTNHENEVISRLSARLKTDVEFDNLGGSISAVITKDNKVIWANAFGYADRDKKMLADTVTIYRIGSITKTFTATLLMLLVEENKISLDDEVEKYVPEVKGLIGYSDKHKITIRQLASHTSGLKREPDLGNANIGSIDQWQQKVLECIPHTSFASKPGSDFLYSNIGFAILGLTLERAAGEPYIKMVQQRIIEPLYMKDTFFSVPDDKRSRLAEGLDNQSGTVNTRVPFREHSGRGYRVPNGALYSTPTDLAKFVTSFIVQPTLLSKASIKKMEDIPYVSKQYGLGLTVHSGMNRNTIGHDGSTAGYTSQFIINLDSKYAIILMRNYNQGSTDLNKMAYDVIRDLF
ncbi:serine hydrolase domain-containing protein [Mucilaginibacter sp. dw_454]|uniref:serine hydrolase domain-containing protein n=1 Tax=Mucilaginibacter sp. dw_454 TaxID=2720079 RepID=UPI001BD5EC45|nr:serine hydrolase domain-containing protein [Mucilaginibacter sp. dw_454]